VGTGRSGFNPWGYLLQRVFRSLPLMLATLLVTVLFAFVPLGLRFTGRQGAISIGFDPGRYLRGTLSYLGGLTHGTLGSTFRGSPVSHELLKVVPRSLVLLVPSLLLALLIGLTLGILASQKWGARKGRSLFLLLPMTVMAAPDFFIAAACQYILVRTFRLWGIKVLPVAGFEGWRYAVLPTLVLSLLPISYIARVAVNAVDNVSVRDFVRTAEAKGLSRTRVLLRHVVVPALAEILDVMPALVPAVLGSQIIVEYFFYWPGLAYHMLNAFGTSWRGPSDFSTIAGSALVLVFIGSLLRLLFSIVADLVNPKMREVVR